MCTWVDGSNSEPKTTAYETCTWVDGSNDFSLAVVTPCPSVRCTALLSLPFVSEVVHTDNNCFSEEFSPNSALTEQFLGLSPMKMGQVLYVEIWVPWKVVPLCL
jgi:hypothetical protein